MGIVGLDQQQQFAFLSEVESTRNLLAYGLSVLRTDALVDNVRDPILTMLSSGQERLYKLTLGVAELDQHGSWPAKNVMKSYGHNIETLHTLVLDELRTQCTPNDYLRGLLAAVESDTVLPPMIRCLNMYGEQGRYYFLDLLGKDQQPRDRPQRYWIEVDTAAAAATDHLTALRNAHGDPDTTAHLQRTHRDRIARSIEDVWGAIAQTGKLHAWGSAGSLFGREIDPRSVGRQSPITRRPGSPPQQS